jgi:hypothetical protein
MVQKPIEIVVLKASPGIYSVPKWPYSQHHLEHNPHSESLRRMALTEKDTMREKDYLIQRSTH